MLAWCCHFSHVRLCDSTDCSPPGSSVYGIFLARILERAVPSSRGSSWRRGRTHVCLHLLHYPLSHLGSPLNIMLAPKNIYICCHAQSTSSANIKKRIPFFSINLYWLKSVNFILTDKAWQLGVNVGVLVFSSSRRCYQLYYTQLLYKPVKRKKKKKLLWNVFST